MSILSGVRSFYNLDDQNSDALIVEQHRIMAKQLPSQYAAAIVSLICMGAVNIDTAPAWLAIYIPLGMALFGMTRFVYWRKATRKLDSFSMEKRKSDIRKIMILAPLLTSLSALLALLMMPYGNVYQQSLTLALSWGTIIVSCYSMSAVPGAAISALVLSNIPLTIGFLYSRDYTVVIVGLGLLSFSFISILIMYNSYKAIGNLVKTRAKLFDRHKEVEWLANTDTLTGLANRSSFNEYLQGRITQPDADKSQFAVFVLDLDGFKQINNLFCHVGGDRILKEVGDRLVKVIGKSGLVSRLSSDEFHIVVDDVSDDRDAQHLGECVQQVLNAPFCIEETEVFITASIGIAMFPDAGTRPGDLIKHAVQAQNKAKKEGGGKTLVFSAKFEEELLESSRLEIALKAAVQNDEIEVYFQPIVDLKTGRYVSFETLARWFHPEMGFVSPDVFIKIAEEKGLIEALTINLLRKAVKVAVTWPKDIMVSFNLSAEQVCDPDFVSTIHSILNEFGLAPERFDAELTETAIMRDMEKAIVTIGNLRELGVSISLDDFGTGYSSLSQIKNFPLDKLKVDKSFIDDVCVSIKMENMVRAIMSMCSVLELKTVSEGIESREQLKVLQETGCDFGQGFLFARPMPADKLPKDFSYAPLVNSMTNSVTNSQKSQKVA